MGSEEMISLALSYGQIAKENPEFPAIIREHRVISHSDFWQVVRSFAFRLRSEGVTAGSLIALNSADILPSLATLFASSLLGSRFVVASKLLAAAKVLQPTHFFRSPEVTGKRRVNFKLIDDSWMPTEHTRALPDDFTDCLAPDADWLYLHTSGTTGRAKYIALSERTVRDRTAAVAADFPFQQTTFATTFKSTSRPFFARAIATLMNAGAIVDSRDLNFWTKAGVNLVCGSPLQVVEFMDGSNLSPPIARIEVSGAKLPQEAALVLLNNFNLVVDVYGAAETSKTFENRVMRDAQGRVTKKGRRLDSEVEIVSAQGYPCKAGEVGSVRIRNPYMVDGYLNAPEASAKSFRDGWFYPGDIATWGENGELVVIGREDDVLNIGGYKLNAGMLDMLFSAVPGIHEAISFLNPKPNAVEKVLVFVVFEKEAVRANVVDTACKLAKTKLGLLLTPSSIRGVAAIPRTEDGEPDRAACRKMVLERAQLPYGTEE
jgi:acyl-coenzyme A synthetase/AMP-(fatty) acid ligase